MTTKTTFIGDMSPLAAVLPEKVVKVVTVVVKKDCCFKYYQYEEDFKFRTYGDDRRQCIGCQEEGSCQRR